MREKPDSISIGVPHGQLLLPQRVVVGNDQVLPVQWSPWEGASIRTSEGCCGPLRLTVTITQAAAMRCELQVINLGEEPVELRELAWTLQLDRPQSITLGPLHEENAIEAEAIATTDAWDFNLMHQTLSAEGTTNRYLSLEYGHSRLLIGSCDVLKFTDGFVRVEPLEMNSARIKISWHRIEPHWDYNGLFSTRPLNGLWIYEGQTRAASLVIAEDINALKTPDAAPPPLAVDDLPLCLKTPETSSVTSADRRAILEKLELFFIESGEYSDLFVGGYDHLNQRQIEPHVCRAEYGEILLHEYARSGDAALWQRTLAFAERFQQTAVNRSLHSQRGGAVRGRYGDNQSANLIRSMRGAAFFFDMAKITGRDDFQRTSLGIAEYLIRSLPWHNARQGAAVRDLMYLWKATDDERYLITSRRIIATLQKAQQSCGAWPEYWNENFEPYKRVVLQ